MRCLPLALAVSLPTLTLSSVTWYQTSSSNGDKLSSKTPLEFDKLHSPTSSSHAVNIDPETTYQAILGFGGALTQSSATVYKQLNDELREELIQSYYSDSGLDFSIGRLPIHSCDFSTESYTFVSDEVDSDLSTFDDEVVYDQNLSLLLIKDALAVNPNLKFFGSPWSPPAWMKDNNNMLYGGKLLDKFKQSWASYFSRWIKAYGNQGVPIWGITVQNEPEASQTWESCIYTAEETRDFVADYLGPTLNSDHPSVKIFGFDHNKDHIKDWSDILLADDSKSKDYIDGIAFHWYSGACFDNVKASFEAYPDAMFLPLEATYELTVLDDDESTEEWLVNGTYTKGEGYGYDILGDLESGSVGWTDWNIVLDQDGGPNHVGNYCDAAVVADVKSEVMTLNYHPQYYYIGHFSKFLKEGALRVKSTVDGEEEMSSDCVWPYGKCDEKTVHTTAFLGEEGGITVVVMNCGDDDKEMELTVDGVDGTLVNVVPAHSIQTYVF